MLGLLILGRGIFWLVFCVMLFLCCDGFLVLVVFGLGMVSTFGGLVSVPFSVLLDAMRVVFILGRWLVWWFGFCGVFWFLSSFASLYRFNFASFDIFLGVVNSSARNVNGSYFLFFEGS